MPAGVGYVTTVNLAAELTNPQQPPAEVVRKATEDSTRGPDAREPTTQQRQEVAASGAGAQGDSSSSGQGGSTTPDRGQKLNLVA